MHSDSKKLHSFVAPPFVAGGLQCYAYGDLHGDP